MDSGLLRAATTRWLIAAALGTALLMGSIFVGLHRVKDLRGPAVEMPAEPLSDVQAAEQVVLAAREFVAAGDLGNPTASYTLLPCRGEEGPPYQGSAYVNFDVPSIAQTPAFFASLLTGMSRRGWSEGVRPNDHPGGRTLGRAGLSAVFYRNPDVPGRGVLRVYGECRTVTDHRGDPIGFVDVTPRLRN